MEISLQNLVNVVKTTLRQLIVAYPLKKQERQKMKEEISEKFDYKWR